MKIKLAIASLVLSLIAPIGSAKAATAIPGAPVGITVSPAYQQISVLPGESSQPVQFKITNNESTAQTFDLSMQDFNTLGESGGLFFVGTNPSQLQKKYGLAKWFSLPNNTLTIAPYQSQTIQAQILNLPDLNPGGHYGALLIAAHARSDGPDTSNKVTLHPIASSLLFVTKVGGDIHSLSLDHVTANHSLFKLPSSATLRFHNDGNTHVVPRGSITITDARGHVVSKGIINEDSNIVLPESYRQLYVPLSKVAAANSIGRYQLKVDFRFDGIAQYREYRSSFTYVPLVVVAGLLVVIAAAALLVWHRSKSAEK